MKFKFLILFIFLALVFNLVYYVDANTCFDSDGGININISGYAYFYNDTYQGIINDSCINSSTVKEAYCNVAGYLFYISIPCINGICSNGACIQTCTPDCNGKQCGSDGCGGTCGTCSLDKICNSSSLCSYSCIDSDAGINYFKFGETNNLSFTRFDTCTSNIILKEFYCSLSKIYSRDYNCPTGCSNGVCNPYTCSDSDNGTNYYETGFSTNNTGTILDSCVDSSSLREYYCSANKTVSTIYKCPSGICREGSCVRQTCFDSDNGANYLTTGTVNNNTGEYTDYCINSTTLFENFCSSNRTYSKIIACPGGCNNGACSNICQDSDSGKLYDILGSTIKGMSKYTDYCITNSTLREYYCNNDTIQGTNYVCPSRICTSGICI